MTQRFIGACVVISGCMCAMPAFAQSTATGDQPGRLTRTLEWAEAKAIGVDGAAGGIRPELGVTMLGGGPAGGVGYRRPLFARRLVIDGSAVVSLRGYKDLQARAELRPLSEKLAIGAEVRYEDGTQINYFGIGRNTSVDALSDYRLRYVDAGGYATLHLSSTVSVTGRGGIMQGTTIAGGTSTVVPTIESRFENAAAPGLGLDPHFVHGDLALEVDTRDVKGYPRSGGRYRASFAAYHDRSGGRFSFGRIEGEASQYVPIGDRSVAAVHARLDVSQTADGHEVPFYLLPALGSGQSLRGYDDYRFRDRDALLASAELRTRLAGPFDVAGFVDTGAIAPTVGTLASHRLLTDYGVGLRFHSSRHLIARLDIARGTEGTHVVMSFSPSMSFAKRPVAPFIP